MREFAIFVKAWTPGSVKTRLATVIGGRAAADIDEQSAQVTLRRCEKVAGRRTVVVTPPEGVPWVQEIVGQTWHCTAPTEGELGQRMHAYFAAAFDQGATEALLIGKATKDSGPRKFRG